MIVQEFDEIMPFLKKRNLLQQYEKAKRNVECGNTSGTQLRKRQPASLNVWYFRINQKYRAVCYRQGGTFLVFDIDDHQ